MTVPLHELAVRFREHVCGAGVLGAGDLVLVALSGGMDSVALTHLLRFTPGLPAIRLAAAHVDHRMRDVSRDDARWVQGLTQAWQIPVAVHAAETSPESEEEARVMRYAFLEEEMRLTGARWLVTAHHADDQVETVLFRIARGTGLMGLRGIPEFRAHGLWRPLLPFRRTEIQAYAEAVGLGWREDATNADDSHGRNALRNRVIPLLEDLVAPGAGASVLRLARLAREDENAWESLMPSLVASLEIDHHGSAVSFLREGVLGYHPAVRARLLRAIARQLGGRLDAAGTRIAVEFTSSGRSGTGVTLTGGLEFRRDLERLAFTAGSMPPDAPRLVSISGDPGSGEAHLGGARYLVQWGSEEVEGVWRESFDAESLHQPLTLRAWVPGDRIRMSYGSKKLKKVFLEASLPRSRRDRTPVLVDAREQVLWIPGLLRSTLAQPSGTNRELNIGVTHANTD